MERNAENKKTVLEQSDFLSDDEYLRAIPEMVDSIHKSKKESTESAVTEKKLEW